MSALTKVFIVLQVVLAILLVAGQVVFVNRTEDYKGQATTTREKLEQANHQIADLQAADSANQTMFNQQLANKNSDLSHAQDRIQDIQTQLDTAKTALASAQADLDKAQASGEFSSQALKIALDQNGTLQSQYSDLEKSLATLQKDDSDGSLRIADLTSRLDATQRAREYLAEQNKELADNVDQLNKLLKQNNIKPGQAAGPVTPEPTAPLVGQIQDTKVIDGIPYATINIGSADQVASGMRFAVVSQGTFLGYLKVDQVEPHAASGQLINGPHVSDIHAGDEVRTQL